jgi:hypothetical protein
VHPIVCAPSMDAVQKGFKSPVQPIGGAIAQSQRDRKGVLLHPSGLSGSA